MVPLSQALAFATLALLTAHQIAPRSPVLQSVDLMVPRAPVVFLQEGQAQLVYELDITNFLPVEVAVTRVQVRAPDDAPLATYSDANLRRGLVRPGLRNDHAAPFRDVRRAGRLSLA